MVFVENLLTGVADGSAASRKRGLQEPFDLTERTAEVDRAARNAPLAWTTSSTRSPAITSSGLASRLGRTTNAVETDLV